MAAIRDGLVSEVAARDKYASLHRHLLSVRPEPEWWTVFGGLEAILGYRPVDSARLSRPLWPNLKADIGYRHSVRQVAGWHVPEVEVVAETKMIAEREVSLESGATPVRRQRFSIREILPPHDPGSWPQDFTVSRDQIYDDMGRLTGGTEDMSGDGR